MSLLVTVAAHIVHQATCFARAHLATVLTHDANAILSHVRVALPQNTHIGLFLEAMDTTGQTRVGYFNSKPIGWCKLHQPIPIQTGHTLEFIEFTTPSPYPHLTIFANRIVLITDPHKPEHKGPLNYGPVDFRIQHRAAAAIFNEI